MLPERKLADRETRREARLEGLSAEPALARAILGTTDAAEVFRRLDSFCSARLRSGVDEVLFCEVSVGAVFGTRLDDGRRFLVKAHPPTRPLGFLRAVYGVQRHLFGRGFPCPRPAVPPAPFGSGFATVEDLAEDGSYADTRDPGIRRGSAGTLAGLVRLARNAPGREGLRLRPNRPPEGVLWPDPHGPLFDFGATVAGSAWIEGIAVGAKRLLDRSGGGVVVGHADWCSKHLRFGGDGVTVVYDWDSLGLDTEPAIVGHAAATFPANRHLDAPNVPTPEETWLFVGDYEAARGRPFTERQRRTVAAAAIYNLAYLARCEHAADPARSGRDEYRRALPRHADAYFRTGA